MRRPSATRPTPSVGSAAASTSSAAAIEAGLALKASSIRSKASWSCTDVQHDASRGAPRPAGGCQRPRSSAATRQVERPAPAAAASTPSAFSAKCRPGDRDLEQQRHRPRPSARTTVASRLSVTSTQAEIGCAAGAEQHDRAPPRASAAASRIGVTSADRRCSTAVPPGSSPSKIAAFSRAMPSTLVEGLEMAAATVVISATCGPGQPGERRDLAGMVHADLDHREIGVGGHPRQRQRHAPVVVVARLGGMDAALAGQHRAQHLLGRGLADRAGDADHLARVRARPARAERGQRRPARPARSAAARRPPRPRARATPARRRRPCPAPRRRSRGRRATSVRATNRSPGCSVRVSIDTPVAAKSRRRPPAGGGGRLGGGPERGHDTRPVQRGDGDAGLFGIVEGIDVVADDLAGLVALAGDQQRVARAERVDAAQDRLGPVADLGRAGAALAAPRRGSSAGSSVRGLSSVTMARSACRGRRVAPSAGACRGRGRRRRRRRRSAGP